MKTRCRDVKRRVVLGLAAGAAIGGALAISRLGGGSFRNGVSALVSESDVVIEDGTTYGVHDRHRLDVYRPTTADTDGPIVLFLYGGGWKSGDRRTYRFVGSALASRGVTTVIPDYRLYPEVRFPSFVDDAALAYDWTWKNIASQGGKPRPIVLFGHSAGAHTGALLAYDRRYLARRSEQSPQPAAFIGLAGPYAFDPTTWPTTKAIFADVSDADQARPVAFADAMAPPTLVMHGLDDQTVRLWNTRTLAEALTKAGAKVEKREFSDIGHVGVIVAMARPFRWRAPVLTETIEFIRRFSG